MPAHVLDGRALARRIEADLADRVKALKQAHGKAPGLAVVIVGEDPASIVYVGRKAKACARVGIESTEHRLPADTSEDALVGLIEGMNRDADINGILVQLPLPDHIDAGRVVRAVTPYKDVDAFHPESVGFAMLGQERNAPCTPQGVLLLLDDAGIELAGKHIVIVNHSNIVGKPLAAMCMNRDATVTVCNKFTADLAEHTRRADVLVSGAGVAGLIQADMVKEGAAVVDVAIVRNDDGTLVGDVASGVDEVAGYLSPVPGGVGPMTIAVLLQNTVRSFERKMGLLPPP